MMVLLPATAPSVVIVAMAVEATVSVTVTGLGGNAFRLTDTDCCRSRPTCTLLIEIVGAVTVAVSVRNVLGVPKPAGGTTWTSEVPDAAGSNAAFFTESPGLKVTVPGVMTPTPGPPV